MKTFTVKMRPQRVVICFTTPARAQEGESYAEYCKRIAQGAKK